VRGRRESGKTRRLRLHTSGLAPRCSRVCPEVVLGLSRRSRQGPVAWLGRDNPPAKQVQMVLGHASAVITLQTYSHLWPGDDDRKQDVMDALSPLADSLRTARRPMGNAAGQTACAVPAAFLAFL
jgi:hypothetical protein